MRRWHSEVALMRQRMSFAWGDHHIRDSVCGCRRCSSDGIGWYRDRHPRDCGNPRCGVCHCDKFGRKKRQAKRRAAVEFDLRAG